jgi:hypothetical protein
MNEHFDGDRKLFAVQRDERNPLRADRSARPAIGLGFAGRSRAKARSLWTDNRMDRAQEFNRVRSIDDALILRLCHHIGLPHDTPVRSLVQPWVSATFSGTRHEIMFELGSDGALAQASSFADQVEEAEFDVPGYIVADIQARLVEAPACRIGHPPYCGRLQVEALTVVSV